MKNLTIEHRKTLLRAWQTCNNLYSMINGESHINEDDIKTNSKNDYTWMEHTWSRMFANLNYELIKNTGKQWNEIKFEDFQVTID